MGVGRFARRAVIWIRRAVKFFKAHDADVAQALRVLRLAGVMPKKLLRWTKALEKLETTTGAHTAFWDKVETAARSRQGVELTAAEVKYAAGFKRLWDKHYPGKNLPKRAT